MVDVFHNFPQDLIIEIFSNLSAENLKNVRSTCKKFEEIINSSPALLNAIPIKSKQLNESLYWLRESKYSNLCYETTNRQMPLLINALDIMADRLFTLELNICK